MKRPTQYFLSKFYKSMLPTTLFVERLGSTHPNIDPKKIFESTHFSLDDINNPYAFISLLNVKKVRVNASNCGLNPIEIGLIWGGDSIAELGFFGELMASAPTPRDAIKYFIKYADVFEYMPFPMKISESDGLFTLFFSFKLHESETCNVVADSTFVKKWSYILKALGLRDEDKLMFNVTHKKPDNAYLYEDHDVHNIRFEQPKLSFSVKQRFLDRPNPAFDRQRHWEAMEHCQPYLNRPPESTSTQSIQKIYHYISHCIMPKEKPEILSPSIQEAARKMNLSESTLRRELSGHDTNFKECLEESRVAFASAYLKYTKFSVNEIAYRTAYTDTANFRRAFKKWFNMSPVDYRKQHSIYN